ncbi:hypothetical protein ES703_98272 [subsurface metagenome]
MDSRIAEAIDHQASHGAVPGGNVQPAVIVEFDHVDSIQLDKQRSRGILGGRRRAGLSVSVNGHRGGDLRQGPYRRNGVRTCAGDIEGNDVRPGTGVGDLDCLP